MATLMHENHFVVHTGHCSWWVSTEMARHIERALDARRPARWTTFVDVTGARIRILTDATYCVEQCTAEQRAIWRQIREARDAEDGY